MVREGFLEKVLPGLPWRLAARLGLGLEPDMQWALWPTFQVRW